jgi:hypothetical protein
VLGHDLGGELEAAASRQDDIGHQDVQMGNLVQRLDRLVGIHGDMDRGTAVRQEQLQEGQEGGVVLHHEKGLALECGNF